MRVYLQAPASSDAAPKFCHLVLAQDLLGHWTLSRETGQQGARSQLRREVFTDQVSAQQAWEHARDQCLQRGFRVMFVEGTDARSAGDLR